MEIYNNLNNDTNNYVTCNYSNENSGGVNEGETNPLRKNGFFNRIIDILTLKPENNRLDIGGLSFDMDNVIIIGIIFFLLTDNSTDILLIICLGLSLLNIDLNPFA